MRNTAIAPAPDGVASATIVSCGIIIKSFCKDTLVFCFEFIVSLKQKSEI